MDGDEEAGWTIPTRDGPDRLLTKSQVMRTLGISDQKFSQLVNDGVLKRLRHNGTWFVRQSWLADYWDHLSDQAEAEREQNIRAKRRSKTT